MLSSVVRPRYFFRYSDVVSSVASAGALSRRQVEVLCFDGPGSYPAWKARTRLKKLYDAKLLRRGFCEVANDYIYWKDKKPDNLNHLILINWVYVALNKTGRLTAFDWKTPYTDPIPDAYFTVDNKPFFLEVQRSGYGRENKVEKYTKFFASGIWDTSDWPTPGQFARIVVAADTSREADRLAVLIDKKNKIGLKFIVASIDDLCNNAIPLLFSEKKVIKWVL